MNIFRNCIPHKIKKFDYKTPEWINKSITLYLKKQFKLPKKYYMNPTANNKEAIDIKSKECASLTNESKGRYIAKMNAKLDNPKTVPKTYWSIKKFLSYPLFLLTVNWYQTLNKKLISSTTILPLNVLLLKMVANY